jgi:hypothetical protein
VRLATLTGCSASKSLQYWRKCVASPDATVLG